MRQQQRNAKRRRNVRWERERKEKRLLRKKKEIQKVRRERGVRGDDHKNLCCLNSLITMGSSPKLYTADSLEELS